MTGSPTSRGRCEARLESRVSESERRLSERDVTDDLDVDPIFTAEPGVYALLCLLGGVTGTVRSPCRELLAEVDDGGRPILVRGTFAEILVLE